MVMQARGLKWSAAMRGARGEDGKPCENCGADAHNVLMVGVPTPGGLEFEGQLRLCDACADDVLENGDAMELLRRREMVEDPEDGL